MTTTPTPRRTTARKPATGAANGKAPATASGKAPTAKANGAAASPEAGHRAYLTKDITDTMLRYTRWLSREYPELGAWDPRMVSIASKAYRAFQSSDLNR